MIRGLFSEKCLRFVTSSNRLCNKSSAFDKKIWSTRKSSNLSYDHGPSDTKMLYKTIGGLLSEATQEIPDKTAVISCHQNIEKTYEQLHHDVTRFAAGLLALGLERGDKVAILSPNHYEWIVTQFAVAMAGLVLTALNPAYMEPEIKFALHKAECKVIVMADGFKGKSYFDMLSNIIPALSTRKRGEISCKQLPKLMTIITFNSQPKKSTYSLESIISSGEEKTAMLKLDSHANKVQPDDVANIQFTSGTTGYPKAVLLSHHMIINAIFFIGRRLRYTLKNDVICLSVPLFHCFGCVVGTTASVCFGLSVVLPSPGFSPKATLKAIEDKKCTMLYGTPTMFIDMLSTKDFDKFNFYSVRGGLLAASSCPEELLKAINKNMNMKDVSVGYGTTENSPVITLTHPEDPLHIRCSTVGKVIDHVEIKIIDSDGLTVKRGDEGELCARGFQVMHGYLNDPEETNRAIGDDRWYKTGDIATMDDHGYVRIVGRIKDMIIRGGENIYPREVEEFLHTHLDIAIAEVFGIPDQRLGEIVCVWIKLKLHRSVTATQVKEFCKDKIANHKIPEHIIFVNEFPTTESGKVQKFKLRELMIKELAS